MSDCLCDIYASECEEHARVSAVRDTERNSVGKYGVLWKATFEDAIGSTKTAILELERSMPTKDKAATVDERLIARDHLIDLEWFLRNARVKLENDVYLPGQPEGDQAENQF